MMDRERRFNLPNVVVLGMLLSSLPVGVTLRNNRNHGMKLENMRRRQLQELREDFFSENFNRDMLLLDGVIVVEITSKVAL